MAVDIQDLFNNKLPGALERNAEDAKEIDATFQLNIEGAGQWFVDCSEDNGVSCKPGTGDDPDVTMAMSAEDFQELYEDPQTAGMSLFFAGKLKVEGNQMLALKMSKLFAYE